MPVWDTLHAFRLPLRLHWLKANCDICGKKNAAIKTARTTPVGASWVGGKECYATCCDDCFPKASIFHNPAVSLVDPHYYDDHEDELRRVTGLSRGTFCAAAAAAIIAFEGGAAGKLAATRCPRCREPHIDMYESALKPHR